jgi:hypothetical protein
MVKDTCLVALKRKYRSPHILSLEILVRQLWNEFSLHTRKTIMHTTWCGNDLNAKRKLLQEIWHKNHLIQSYN